MTDFNKLSEFNLGHGSHISAESGLCAMEAVAWLEGLEHTDKPKCTCPIIAAYVRNINDHLSPIDRQKLIEYLPRLVGTVSFEHEYERSNFLAMKIIKVFTPITLENINLHDKANEYKSFDGTDSSIEKLKIINDELRTEIKEDSYTPYSASGLCALAALNSVQWALERFRSLHYVNKESIAGYAGYIACYASKSISNVDIVFDTLDELLAIGKQAEPFSRDVTEAVDSYRELIAA